MVKKVRLEDLAEQAGVSIATVSRALNDSASVNDATKRKIMKLAREAGYHFRPHMPHSLDQSVATLSILVPAPQGRDGWLHDPFFLELLGGIGEAARQNQCDFLVSHTTPQTFDDLARVLETTRADGVIILGQSFLHDRLNRLMDRGTPFIVWGGELAGQKYASVGTDNLRGGRRATAHLARWGRKRIAFFGDTEAPEIAQRYEGYQQALREHDLEFDPRLVVNAHFRVESAEAAVDTLIAQGIEFDAIFGASDIIAHGSIKQLMKMGRSVPDDVAVVGYDNLMFSELTRPALTTVNQDLLKAGHLMVRKLLSANNVRDIQSERLPTEIIVRESCGAS